jgi:hypothetical protein
VLFVLTCPSATMAMAFVAKQTSEGQMTCTVTEAELQELYLAKPLHIVQQIADQTGGVRKVIMAEALAFQRDYKLHQWVHEQNVMKGMAPTTHLMVRHIRLQDPSIEPFAMPNWRTALPRTACRWVQRWRHRWALRRGCLPSRDKLSVDVMRLKAPWKYLWSFLI